MKALSIGITGWMSVGSAPPSWAAEPGRLIASAVNAFSVPVSPQPVLVEPVGVIHLAVGFSLACTLFVALLSFLHQKLRR